MQERDKKFDCWNCWLRDECQRGILWAYDDCIWQEFEEDFLRKHSIDGLYLSTQFPYL